MNLEKKITYGFDMDASIPYNSIVNLQQLVFETTSCCNLKCTYCGYGELYNTKRVVAGKNMDFFTAKLLIDYLYHIWKDNPPLLFDHTTFFGFYGGEPLININLVKQIISYLESLPRLPNRTFDYTMTTNALLLDRCVDFIASKKIKLLISLDGDEFAHSYRIDHEDQNSFARVMANIYLLKDKYPEYFEECVSFNSVLNDRSNYFSIKEYIYSKFGKYPTVSELNNSGVLKEKKNIFDKMNHLEIDDWSNVSDIKKLDQFVLESPKIKQLTKLIKYLSGNSFGSLNSLLSEQYSATFPTGTCLPFDRKMYLTVEGDILPCERIHPKYKLGNVIGDEVCIDFDYVANKYSNLYKAIWKQCRTCYAKPICEMCMFYVDDLETNPNCHLYQSKQEYGHYITSLVNYLSEHPYLYKTIVENIH